MFKNILWYITRILCIYTLFAYCFGYLLKPDHWLVGFIQLSIEPCLIICFILALIWLFNSKIRAFYPMAVLLLGYPFLSRTVQFHNNLTESEKADFTVLNYNVSGFWSDSYYNTKNPDPTIKSIDFAADFDADVKCFQDFYNWDETPITRSIKPISRKNTPYFVSTKQKDSTMQNQGNLGLIIFARYPLKYIAHEHFGTPGNGILVADLEIKNKIVRIINVQLQSTGVRVGKVVMGNSKTFAKESRSLLSSLKHGFINRFEQEKLLEKYIKNSPYSVILCGDFNEVPYGQVYGKISKLLKNAYEAKGYGFGFTLNRSPRVVRIDNQFYSANSIKVQKFETLHEVDHSDHFPLYAEYSFVK